MTGEWQPIETAPVGTNILVAFLNGDRMVAHKDDLPGAEGFYAAFGVGELLETPTHWMPLPPPPRSRLP